MLSEWSDAIKRLEHCCREAHSVQQCRQLGVAGVDHSREVANLSTRAIVSNKIYMHMRLIKQLYVCVNTANLTFSENQVCSRVSRAAPLNDCEDRPSL